MSRSRRASRTFAASLAASVIGMLVGLVTTPILLRYLGDERMGVYRVALEWIGYAALLDFGLSGALQVMLARSVGIGDRRGVASAVRAGMRGAMLTAVLGALYAIGLAVAAPLLLGGLTPELGDELRFGLLLGLIGSAWVPLAAFRPLAEASQRGQIIHVSIAIQAVAMAGMSVGFAAAGFGLPGQFLAVALGNGIGMACITFDGLRHYPEILTQASGPPVPLRTAFSGAIFAFQLFSRLSLVSDCIVVGYVLGPVAVVIFSLTQRLLLIVDTQVLALGGSAWAALAELHHTGNSAAFDARLTQLTRWTAILALTLAVPTAAFSRSFVHLWVGPERFGGDGLIWYTVAYVWLHGVVGMWGWPIVSTGRVRKILIAMAAGAAVNLAVSIGFTAGVGVAGPAIGSAVTMAFVLAWPILRVLKREFGTPVGPLLSAAIRPALLSVPYAAACALLADAFSPQDFEGLAWVKWVATLGGMAAGALGYSALAWFLILPRKDRGDIRARLFRL